MRQMRKKIIIAIIVTLLLTAGIALAIGFFIVKGRDTVISELQTQVADIKCVAFSSDLKADSIITPSDIKRIDYKESSLTNGCYFYMKKKDKNGEYEKDSNGNFKWELKHYIAYTDENGEEHSHAEAAVEASLYDRVVKTNVSENTPVLDTLLYPESEAPNKDERIQEFNFLQIPSDLVENDYIDVRIQFPTGEDYSVLIGKKIEKIAGENTIFIKMNEEEIMAMGSAIIEAYMQKGVKLYANKYSDPATQLFNEAIVDYVAKYEDAVEKLIKEKNEVALRKAVAQKFVDDKLYVEVNPIALGLSENISGMIKYTAQAGETIIENDKELVLDAAREIDLYVEKNSDGELLITVDSMKLVTDTIKEELAEDLPEVDVEELENDILAIYAGIDEDYIEEIKYAVLEEDDEILTYYKIMRVTTRDEIIRSYPVREEVLAVIKNNPNLLETIKAEFDQVALTNTRIDEYKKLEAEYNAEFDEYKKEEIKNKMEELVSTRVENVEKSIEAEVAAQRAERVSYLESLIESSTTTTEE